MLDISGNAQPSRVSFDAQLVGALNKLDFTGAQQALIAIIKQTVGVKNSWSSPQYATSRAVQQSITLDHSRDNLLTFFALDTLRDRYFLRDAEGVICETPQDFFARVATGVACADKTSLEVSKLPHEDFDDIAIYAQKLYDVLSQLHALFATPILTNAGTNRGMLISCFLNESDDSIRDIFGTYEENAVLAQGGGGIGTYWGKLRGQGSKLSRGGKSSGPLPFLKVFDSATLAVHQAGARRGAAAAYIDVSHPDIEDFVDMRRPEGAEERRCQNVHHGICLSDAFMAAVRDRKPWDLIDPHHKNVVRTVDAYGLWKRIVMTRVMTGEPYMLFIDTVNKTQPQAYKDKNLEVKTSNLCIEITLPTSPGRAENGGRTAICCLGSINFAKYEEWKSYGPELHYLMVRGLDNVLEHFIHHAGAGYEKAVIAAKNGRDIGLGAMGWFDYLQQRTIPFESIEARAHNKMRFKEFGQWSDDASLRLAKERGAAPDGGPFRNVNRQAIAPTATIGIIAGASPSIEPPAGNVFRQETLSGKYIVRNPSLEKLLADKYSSHNTEATWQSITESSGSVQHLDWMDADDRKAFKTAYELNQRELVQQAADRQPYISQSQSLNLFFAPGSSGNLSASYLHDVHFMAWELGVKSLYYCRSQSVLTMASTAAKKSVQQVIDKASSEECTVCQ
jgi:ribonucleoside-diphosphate reductase alpha chain